VFQGLSEPGERHGLYQSFLSHELVEKLSVADIPEALAWAERQPEHNGSFLGYDGLVMRIIDKAADHLEESGILVALARTLMVRLRKHDFSHWKQNETLSF
jgi:hypothetical protein